MGTASKHLHWLRRSSGGVGGFSGTRAGTVSLSMRFIYATAKTIGVSESFVRQNIK